MYVGTQMSWTARPDLRIWNTSFDISQEDIRDHEKSLRAHVPTRIPGLFASI